MSIILFSDDFARAKKAKWCPVDALYLAFGNISLEQRFLHENVFVFSIMDMTSYSDTIQVLQDSIQEFNSMNLDYEFASLNRRFKIKVILQLIACDNPRAMGILNLATGNPTYYCRTCFATKDQYSNICSYRTTVHHESILARLRTVPHRNRQKPIVYGIKANRNLTLHSCEFFEPFHDIPFDILHSVYLGLIKHALKATANFMNSNEKTDFMKFYKQLNTSEIPYFPRGNVLINSKSLTGKDFKLISQVIIVCLENSLSDFPGKRNLNQQYLNAWNYICYITKFVNLKYISPSNFEKFESIIEKAVDYIGIIIPKLRNSIKLHLCVHLPENIRRHGPPLGYSTEVFESLNKTMRKFICKTNQKKFCNDALKSHYKNFRANYIQKRIQERDIGPYADLESTDLASGCNLNFSWLEFDGYFNKFLLHSKYRTNSFLASILGNFLQRFQLYKKIRKQNINHVFLKKENNFYLFIVGIKIPSQIDQFYFLGKILAPVDDENLYILSDFYTVEEFCNVELANFQHACKRLNCNYSISRIIHSSVQIYSLNSWTF